MARFRVFDVAPVNLVAATFFPPGAIRTGSSGTGATYANPSGTIVALDASGVAVDGLGRPLAGTVLNVTLYAADFTTPLAGFSELALPLVDFEAAWFGPSPVDMFAFLLGADDTLRGGGDDRIDGAGGINSVAIAGGSALDFTEGFAVSLAQPVSGAVFGTAPAFGTILTDNSVISIAPLKAHRAEGTGGFTPFTFALTAAGDTSTTRTVTYVGAGATLPGTVPAQFGDFFGAQYPTGTVTFAPGETSQTITVSVKADTVGELNEAFAINLFPWAGTTVGTATATGIILNDDTSFRIVKDYYSDRDEGIAAIFTVQRSGNLGGTNAISYAVTGTGSTPATAADFPASVLPSGSVTFAPGETSKTIQIPSKGDAAIEPDEQFQVTLFGPTGDAAIDPSGATATGSILNNDALLSISGTSAKAEGSTGGATLFTFVATRTGDISTTHSAKYTVAGINGLNTGPANAADFVGGVFPTGIITFPYGMTKQTVTIPVNVRADTVAELNERFVVTLSDPSPGATLGSTTGQGIILNDDSALSIATTSASKPEGIGATPFTFAVSRFGDTTKAQTAKWAVSGSSRGGATGADFVGGIFPSGTVTFAPGATRQTITVNVAGDAIYEPDQGFTVTLSAPTGGATITTATADGTILNDDTSLAITPANVSKPEGTGGSTPYIFTVNRVGITTGTTTVHWALAPGGVKGTVPVNAKDFLGGSLPPGGTLTFAAGQTSRTISLAIGADIAPELNESFTLTLSNPSPGTTITSATATGTVLDDDTIRTASLSGALVPETAHFLPMAPGAAAANALAFGPVGPVGHVGADTLALPPPDASSDTVLVDDFAFNSASDQPRWPDDGAPRRAGGIDTGTAADLTTFMRAAGLVDVPGLAP